MKNKELVTELAARMGWTAQEVAETLSVLSSVVSSRLVDNDTIYLQGFGQRYQQRSVGQASAGIT